MSRSRGPCRSHKGRAGLRQDQGGAALVLVLWVMSFLTVLAVAFVHGVRGETVLARNWVESAQARAAADAGVQLALLELLRDEAPEKWRGDGSVHEVRFAGTDLRIAIADEAGRIDLNAAPPELIDTLLRTAGLQEGERVKLVDAILDWRDPDHLQRPNGAEDRDYLVMGLPYGAKDGPFESVEELALVMGMTPDLYRKLEGALTVHSGSPGINPAVAPRQALLILFGNDAEQVDAYLRQREQNARDGLPPPPVPPSVDRSFLSDAPGQVFRIQVQARTAGNTMEGIIAVLKPLPAGGPERPFELLAWTEAAELGFW